MSRFACIVAATLAVSSIPANAEEKMVVDMRKMTCAQLTKLGFQDFAGLTMWLSGYCKPARNRARHDRARAGHQAAKVNHDGTITPFPSVCASNTR